MAPSIFSRHDDPICTDLLERSAENPPKNIREVGEFLVMFTRCFLALARTVYRIDRTLYGNTDTGAERVAGMDEVIRNMDARIQEHEKREQLWMDELNKKLNVHPPETKDLFTDILIWFRDKVLPQLVTAAITGALVWIVAVNSFISP